MQRGCCQLRSCWEAFSHSGILAYCADVRIIPQVGGRLSDVFDEDPKRWRMLAETLATVGLSLEIATSFSPSESRAKICCHMYRCLYAGARADAVVCGSALNGLLLPCGQCCHHATQAAAVSQQTS